MESSKADNLILPKGITEAQAVKALRKVVATEDISQGMNYLIEAIGLELGVDFMPYRAWVKRALAQVMEESKAAKKAKEAREEKEEKETQKIDENLQTEQNDNGQKEQEQEPNLLEIDEKKLVPELKSFLQKLEDKGQRDKVTMKQVMEFLFQKFPGTNLKAKKPFVQEFLMTSIEEQHTNESDDEEEPALNLIKAGTTQSIWTKPRNTTDLMETEEETAPQVEVAEKDLQNSMLPVETADQEDSQIESKAPIEARADEISEDSKEEVEDLKVTQNMEKISSENDDGREKETQKSQQLADRDGKSLKDDESGLSSEDDTDDESGTRDFGSPITLPSRDEELPEKLKAMEGFHSDDLLSDSDEETQTAKPKPRRFSKGKKQKQKRPEGKPAKSRTTGMTARRKAIYNKRTHINRNQKNDILSDSNESGNEQGQSESEADPSLETEEQEKQKDARKEEKKKENSKKKKKKKEKSKEDTIQEEMQALEMTDEAMDAIRDMLFEDELQMKLAAKQKHAEILQRIKSKQMQINQKIIEDTDKELEILAQQAAANKAQLDATSENEDADEEDETGEDQGVENDGDGSVTKDMEEDSDDDFELEIVMEDEEEIPISQAPRPIDFLSSDSKVQPKPNPKPLQPSFFATHKTDADFRRANLKKNLKKQALDQGAEQYVRSVTEDHKVDWRKELQKMKVQDLYRQKNVQRQAEEMRKIQGVSSLFENENEGEVEFDVNDDINSSDVKKTDDADIEEDEEALAARLQQQEQNHKADADVLDIATGKGKAVTGEEESDEEVELTSKAKDDDHILASDDDGNAGDQIVVTDKADEKSKVVAKSMDPEMQQEDTMDTEQMTNQVETRSDTRDEDENKDSAPPQPVTKKADSSDRASEDNTMMDAPTPAINKPVVRTYGFKALKEASKKAAELKQQATVAQELEDIFDSSEVISDEEVDGAGEDEALKPIETETETQGLEPQVPLQLQVTESQFLELEDNGVGGAIGTIKPDAKDGQMDGETAALNISEENKNKVIQNDGRAEQPKEQKLHLTAEGNLSKARKQKNLMSFFTDKAKDSSQSASEKKSQVGSQDTKQTQKKRGIEAFFSNDSKVSQEQAKEIKSMEDSDDDLPVAFSVEAGNDDLEEWISDSEEEEESENTSKERSRLKQRTRRKKGSKKKTNEQPQAAVAKASEEEQVGADEESSAPKDKAAAYRAMLEAEMEKEKSRKRAKKSGFLEVEAEESDEEVSATRGLADFGFGTVKKVQEEKDSDDEAPAEPDDLEGIVDEVSDNEEDDVENLQRMMKETEEREDKEALAEAYLKLHKGFDQGKRNYIHANSRGRMKLDKLLAEDRKSKREAKRLGIQNSDDEDSEEDLLDQIEDLTEEQLAMKLEEEQRRRMQNSATLADYDSSSSESEDENEDPELGELDPLDKEDKEEEMKARHFHRGAKMRRALAERQQQQQTSENSRLRFIEEDQESQTIFGLLQRTNTSTSRKHITKKNPDEDAKNNKVQQSHDSLMENSLLVAPSSLKRAKTLQESNTEEIQSLSKSILGIKSKKAPLSRGFSHHGSFLNRKNSTLASKSKKKSVSKQFAFGQADTADSQSAWENTSQQDSFMADDNTNSTMQSLPIPSTSLKRKSSSLPGKKLNGNLALSESLSGSLWAGIERKRCKKKSSI